jgi:glycosyltransferase involved in cell wall biosynthesis
MRVAYVTWGEWGSGVYASQVIDVVEELRKAVEVDLAVLLSKRARSSVAPVEGVHVLDGPLAGRWPVMSFRLRSRGLTRILAARQPSVVHCRGPLATLAAHRSRRGAALIHDYRGLDAAEIEAESGASWFTARMGRLERRACEVADTVSVVSAPLGRRVVETYGVDPEKVVVIPTAARVSAFAWDQEASARARETLGLRGPVVAYVGSAANWQLPSVCVATAACIVAAIDGSFLVFSQDEATFRQLAKHYGIPGDRLRIKTVSRDKLHQLLCAADVALLPRAQGAVNDVASPVKYAEYLAAGVPVVTVRGAGPFAAEVEQLHLGDVAETPDPEALAAAALETLQEPLAIRERCRRAASTYDLRNIADRYLEVYRRLASG